MRIRSYAANAGMGVIGVLAVAGVWSLLSLTDSTGARFPSIARVAGAVAQNFNQSRALQYAAYGSGGIWSNLIWTAWNVYLGVAIGLVAGFTVGVALARLAWLEKLAELPLSLMGTVPVLVLLPFLSIWFGTSALATRGLVIFYTALTVMTSVQQSTRRAVERYGDYAASLGLSPLRLSTAILPAVIPATVGVVRAAIGFGWGFECIAELLGGRSGVGVLISTFSNETDTAGVVGVVASIALAAVITDAVVALAGRRLVRWNE
jgi:ABC-type nitrate/sulfonate/bicarbonate transport system permease component